MVTEVLAGVFRPRGSLQLAFTVIVPGDAPLVFRVAVLSSPVMVPAVAGSLPTLTGTLSGLVQVQVTVTVAPACTLAGLDEQETVGGFFGGSFTVKFAEALAELLFLALGSVIFTAAVQFPPEAPWVSMLAVAPVPLIFPHVLDHS